LRVKIPFTNRYLELRTSLANPDKWLIDWFSGGGKSASGVTVNENTALNATAVFSAVDILSRTLASLPLPVYKRLQGGGKERATNHPLYSILHNLPNREMTSFELRQALMGHLALWGNAFAEIERDNAGRVIGLWPLRPDRMTVKRDERGLLYIYRIGTTGQEVALRQRNVMHIRGLSSDGVIGYSPIRLAREAIGLTLATEEFGARFFGNGSRPGGVLQHPGKLSEEASKRLKKSWEEMHQGLTQAHRVAILEEGMTWQQVGIPPEDAQFLETRKFQVTEIARIFHVPPHMLADLERSTFSNIEHQGIEFVVHTMRPWLVCWEQAMYRDLFLPTERQTYFTEFLVDGLLRGDTESRYRAYATGRQWGWLSANDVRELENMNPVEGGDTYLIPLNMIPADTAGSAPQPPEGTGQRSEKRSMPARAKRPEQYYRVFKSATERLVKWEASEIRSLVRKHLARSTRDINTFNIELDAWYSKDTTKERIRKYMLPVIASYASVIAADAQEEVGNELAAGWADVQANGYTEIYVRDHIDNSKGQIQALARKQEPEVAINERLDEWGEKRPDKIAKWETVNAAGVFARLAFAALGIKYLRWRNGTNPCPYCKSMDGKVVGIDSAFTLGNVEAEGEPPMRLFRNPKNPPLHEGCSCFIEPSR